MTRPVAGSRSPHLAGAVYRRLVQASLLLLSVGAGQSASAQSAVTIQEGSACRTCKVSLIKIASLGGKTSEEGLIGRNAMFGRDSRGRFFVAPTGVPGQVKVFSPDGKGVADFGRRGQGPGEFGEIRRLWVGPGDSVHVFDSDRHTVIAPNLTYARSHPNPSYPWDALFYASGESLQQISWGERSAVGYPVHFVSTTGNVRRSFGAVERVVERDNPYGRYYSLAASGNGHVWLAKHNVYALERWDTTGNLAQRLVRDVAWFKPWTGRKRTGPIIFSLHEDERGRLWVLIENMSGESIIEVIDPTTASVVASQKLPFFTMRMVGDLVANATEMPDGTPILEVYRLVLTQ